MQIFDNLKDKDKTDKDIISDAAKALAEMIGNVIAMKTQSEHDPTEAIPRVFMGAMATMIMDSEGSILADRMYYGPYHAAGMLAGAAIHMRYIKDNRPKEWIELEAQMAEEITLLQSNPQAKLLLACYGAVIEICNISIECYKDKNGNDIHAADPIENQLKTLVEAAEERHRKEG